VANFCSECGTDMRSSGRSAAAPKKVIQKTETKSKRKPSAYAKRYGKAFKRLAAKNKTKAGKWKKDGFKRTQKAAHKAVKK